jgi:hypothetical protein
MNNILLLAILGVGVLVVIVGCSHSNVFGWHEDLGISDQQAAELYQTNQNDPQIIQWKSAVQNEINDFKSTCTGHWKVNMCIIQAKDINSICISHPPTVTGVF